MTGFAEPSATHSIPRRPGVDVEVSTDRQFVTLRQQPSGSTVELRADDVPTLVALLRAATGGSPEKTRPDSE